MKTIILLFLISLSSCINSSYKAEAPKKVKTIPEKAFWSGGVDGGNWYLITSINKSRKEAFIKVYDDHIGELIVSKKFKLKCDNEEGINWNNLKEQISGAFDGKIICLTIIDKSGHRHCYFE